MFLFEIFVFHFLKIFSPTYQSIFFCLWAKTTAWSFKLKPLSATILEGVLNIIKEQKQVVMY